MAAGPGAPPRRGRLLAAAVLVGVPAVLLVATPAGRGVMANGFMQVASIGLPASAVTVLLGAVQVTGAGWARSRLAGAVLALAGTAVAFEGARLVSGAWLILGRGLQLEALFLSTTGAAVVAIVGGVIALGEGARLARAEGSGLVARLAGLAVVAVPLSPVFLLTGDGVAVVVFDDLAEPAFSQFPGDTATLAALVVMLAGLTLVLVSGLVSPTARPAAHLQEALLGSGVLAVVGGYVWHVVRGLSVDTSTTGGALWPGVNVLAVLLAIGAAVAHLAGARSRREASEDERAGVAFEVGGADPP